MKTSERTIDAVAAEIWELKNKSYTQDKKSKKTTWQQVGDHYGVSRIVVWRIANQGYEPKNNEARRKLGLEELIVVRQSRDKHGKFQKRHN